MTNETDKKIIARDEGGWQKETVTKQQYKDDLIPHPATVPMATDQEAGGAITTPEGERKYDK